MTIGELALVLLGAALVVVGLLVIGSRFRSRRGLASYEGDALWRSSLLNKDRVDRINASRETAGGQWVDRLRIILLGVWLVALGAIVIANALL